jgi:phosphoglucosamine mutase
MQVLNLMKSKNVSLSKLASRIKLLPQVLMNIAVEKKQDIRSVPAIMDAIRASEKKLNGRGRILVRPSGTEPKIRVMLEGDDMELINRIGRNISKIIRETMQ